MFYPAQIPETKLGGSQISTLVVLNPSESRRLLAKATVALPEVQNATTNGTLIRSLDRRLEQDLLHERK